MTRRTTKPILALFALLTVLGSQSNAAEASRPNILVNFTDDLDFEESTTAPPMQCPFDGLILSGTREDCSVLHIESIRYFKP
jgi:hypothetical protein